jgi:Rod binding domain-containing protein
MANFSIAALPLDALSSSGPTKLSALSAKATALASTNSGSSTANTATMSPVEAAKRAAIKKTAQDFETTFLSAMLAPMFEGVGAPAPFGGGAGEDAFKSFLTEAFAKQIATRGGVGVAAPVQREMLKLQGLSENPAAPAPKKAA